MVSWIVLQWRWSFTFHTFICTNVHSGNTIKSNLKIKFNNASNINPVQTNDHNWIYIAYKILNNYISSQTYLQNKKLNYQQVEQIQQHPTGIFIIAFRVQMQQHTWKIECSRKLVREERSPPETTAIFEKKKKKKNIKNYSN